MMYSMEKCLGRNGTGTSEEAGLFAGGGESLEQEGVPSDDVVLVSAVAAVSHEIGDILKDELDDGDRIGADLANLSAELGLLAGLADGDTQQDFPTLLKLAMGSRPPLVVLSSTESSSSSSSSWSGRGRARRPSRPARLPRRKPIAKGKEVSRRRSVAARRAARMRVRRVEVVSDASDVGADSDSEDQWTELDDHSGSGSSDTTSKSGTEMDDNYQMAAAAPPQMCQFLLPLITNVPNSVQFRIRHDDILQLLATEEDDQGIPDLPTMDEPQPSQQLEMLSINDTCSYDEPPVTPEEEATLIHYVCGGERGRMAQFQPTEEWLLGVFHSWCEVSALIYTLIGTNASAHRVCGPWAYRVRLGCHCRLCICTVRGEPALACLLRDLVWALAHVGSTVSTAAHIMRALRLSGDKPLLPEEWDLSRLKRIRFSDEGAAIIHNQLMRYSQQNDTARDIITNICYCRQFDKPMDKQYAVERFIRILEGYKDAAIINFKVEMVALTDDPETNAWLEESRPKLVEYLEPYQNSFTASRLHHMATKTQPASLSMWTGYRHSCECTTPKILCAQQRKQLLRSIYSRMSLFGFKHSPYELDESQELPLGPTPVASQRPKKCEPETAGGELQQGDGTGAKPPDSSTPATGNEPPVMGSDNEQSDANAEMDDSSFLTVTDSDEHSTASFEISTSSSLDSASELLLAAAAAVDSDVQPAPTELCRTVRHLMRSIASIERHMDTVLKQCDEWPTGGNDLEARKQVDLGLSEVDRKLMAMYRRLPEVHRRQLQVYRKQKKLSTVCMQLVGEVAPAPPPPGSPPPAPHHLPCRALCPEYHLQRFKEVRRKVMHMRDQQLYYHRLRTWLEDQLKQERDSIPGSKVTLVEELARRAASPKAPRLSAPTKRKLKPLASLTKPHRLLKLLKQKAQTTQLLNDMKKDEAKEADPPEPFPLDKDDNISDADTIVGEKETIDMNQVLATLAQMALSPDKTIQQAFAELNEELKNNKTTSNSEEDYPESVSPPLQENSPTTEAMPAYTPKPTQRLIVNKFKTDDDNAQVTPELNAPLNARRTPAKEEEIKAESENAIAVYKDPSIYKYVTFGLEIKKAMEECQNIINSYSSIADKDGKDSDDGPLSLEQICEVMMSLDKNSAEILKMDDEPIDMNTANTKLAELVESMPQILANMPEIASEFANASFELPEFASIMNSLPEANEAQLTPETLKQIRDLKLSKTRDNVKVTKNTAKRKISRRLKSNVDTDIIGTMTLEFESRDITDLLKDEKELQAFMRNRSTSKEEFKDLLFSISAQVVIAKVFEYLRANKSPELVKCMEDELFALPGNGVNAELYLKASALFDNSVKDALSMRELKDSVRTRFGAWKHYVASHFKTIPLELLESEIEAMLDKFYHYIGDLATKETLGGRDKIVEKLENCRKDEYYDSDEDCVPAKVSMRRISKFLSVSAGNTFDLLLMKMSRMTGEKRSALRNMRFKYVDVLRRCAESQQLCGWILSDPDLAANHIQELMGFAMRTQEKSPDFSNMSVDKKREYFMDRLKEINRFFMDSIPKKSLTGDEWLVMLFRLEQFESKIKDALLKFSPPTKTRQSASEAEILAAKGLSKIIGKSNNVRAVKKIEPVKPEPVKNEEKPKTDDKPKVPIAKRREVIMKCEALIAQKAQKCIKDSFDAIKNYLAEGISIPEHLKEHVNILCANIDIKTLDEELKEVLQISDKEPTVPTAKAIPEPTKPASPVTTDTVTDKPQQSPAKENPKGTIESPVKEIPKEPTLAKETPKELSPQNPEELAKYSAQALRNAKQTLNAVAFQNIAAKNGYSKSESELTDVPSSECKFTSDCKCTACHRDRYISPKDISEHNITKLTFEEAKEKNKTGLEEKKREVKDGKVKAPPKLKPVPKQCENATHQQHVCKVGHTNNGNGSCTGDGADQHCTCCYCTVFGHAPPLTTPVPRNFNETRERLRSILNKKKQLCKTANGDQNTQDKSPQIEKKVNAQTQSTESPKLVLKPVQAQPKPPKNATLQSRQQQRPLTQSQPKPVAQSQPKPVTQSQPKELAQSQQKQIQQKQVFGLQQQAMQPKQAMQPEPQVVMQPQHTMRSLQGMQTKQTFPPQSLQQQQYIQQQLMQQQQEMQQPLRQQQLMQQMQEMQQLQEMQQPLQTKQLQQQTMQPQQSMQQQQPLQQQQSIHSKQSLLQQQLMQLQQQSMQPQQSLLQQQLMQQQPIQQQSMQQQQQSMQQQPQSMQQQQQSMQQQPQSMQQQQQSMQQQPQSMQQQQSLLRQPRQIISPLAQSPTNSSAPALPKTLPPNLTAQAQAKRQALDNQQRLLADQMAKMVVTEKPDAKPVALQRTVPVQVTVVPSLKAEGKVNPNAMEQIRLQQLKQQQQAQFQQLQQQKKPEPIYDLPIHNKPPQQQEQIRQELQKRQQLTQQNNTLNAAPAQSQQAPQLQSQPKPTPQQQQQQPQTKPAQPQPQTPTQPQTQPPQPQTQPPKPQTQQLPQPQQPNQPQQLPQQPKQPQQLQQQPNTQPQQLPQQPKQPQQLPQRPPGKQPMPQHKVTPIQPLPQMPQLMSQAQLLQQQQLIAQQQLLQQRQSRQQQQNSVSLSSRDTSVFSTSSGCSDGSCWQGSRAEDTRDLDALLQYIEGPARHVDRGKKKAKKQRQKAKKTEERLTGECAQLKIEYARVRFEAEALRVAHFSARRRMEETRKALAQMMSAHVPHKSRKKQNKMNPVQKHQYQMLAEKVGELTALMNTTAKELQAAESQVTDCSTRLRHCEKMINDARAVQGKKTSVQLAHEELKRHQHEQLLQDKQYLVEHFKLSKQEQMELQLRDDEMDAQAKLQWQRQLKQQRDLQERQLMQQKQLQMHQLKQQRQLQIEQEMMNRIRIDEAKMMKQRQNEAIAKADCVKANGVPNGPLSGSSSASSVSSTGADRGGSSPASSSGAGGGAGSGGTVLVRRFGADVTVSMAGLQPTLQQRVASNRHIIITKHVDEDAPPPQPKQEKKQTWEQALAHIQQVAKGTKDKKKTKPAPAPTPTPTPTPAKAEPKPKESKPAEDAPLSKKQRKLLARQQAEEEERKQQLLLQKQEAKSKNKKVDPAPTKPDAKKDKKQEQTVEETKTKKEAKKERQAEKKAEMKEEKRKEKEVKPAKNVQVAAKQSKPPQSQPNQHAPTKKEKRESERQAVHVAPLAAMELVNKNTNACEPEKPASCSLMEQLSCGIQVSELRLPPGITLTRVQPSERREAPPIKSVPLWKASQLPAAPTPVARPVPVINADPSMMMFSTAHPEQPPKPIVIPEPQTVGKSKKAKKKAKKAAADAPQPEATKMVTLRNPMFHPNLPPVQVSSPEKPEIRLPDPIPMPPAAACQATITPTSNGMYTIRNPLMSMMHQQSLGGVRAPGPPFPPGPPPAPPKDDYQHRIMNLASFTQKNDDGYSLFKSNGDSQQKNFLTPEYYEDAPPGVSPNPIGTRPPELARPFEEHSLFANPMQRPEPIGTPLKQETSDAGRLYTPFGHEPRNVFRDALFESDVLRGEDAAYTNGDLPYFQRLRVGSKLNSEVSIHHVTDSKFYRQEPVMAAVDIAAGADSLFSRPPAHHGWPQGMSEAEVGAPPESARPAASPHFGAVGTRPHLEPHSMADTMGNLNSLEACERDLDSFKRYDWYFSADHAASRALHVDTHVNHN